MSFLFCFVFQTVIKDMKASDPVSVNCVPVFTLAFELELSCLHYEPKGGGGLGEYTPGMIIAKHLLTNKFRC